MRGVAAIAGIGHTGFAKNLGCSERRAAIQAISAALADAGLTARDVDGLVRFDLEATSEVEVARSLGIPNLRFFAETGYGGGGGCATVGLAGATVVAGFSGRAARASAVKTSGGTNASLLSRRAADAGAATRFGWAVSAAF